MNENINEQKKKISVIIPVYNGEKTIKKCLNSIVNQTYKNIEIIIINDGSTDGTQCICEKYTKEYNNIILKNNENHGVSYSRNFGINIATGDYITFIDADDYLELDCYEKISKLLNENIDCIRYNFNNIDGKSFNNNLYELKNKTIELNNSNNMNKILTHFLTCNESIPNLVMLLFIRTDKIANVRFNENLIMMEDVDFFIKLLSKIDKIKFVDEKLYNYVKNPDSVTHNPQKYIDIIYGILDTNKVLNEDLKKLNCIEIKRDMNTNHLKIISNYLYYYFQNNNINFIKKTKEISNNNIIQDLFKNYNIRSLPKNKRIFIVLLKNKFIFLLYIYILFYSKFKKKIKL